jgi:hypothetical protein
MLRSCSSLRTLPECEREGMASTTACSSAGSWTKFLTTKPERGERLVNHLPVFV